MKQIEQKPIGNIYFDELHTAYSDSDYKDVTVETLKGDEAPQLMITVPLNILGTIMKHEMCVYITEEGVKHLKTCVLECERRLNDMDLQERVKKL